MRPSFSNADSPYRLEGDAEKATYVFKNPSRLPHLSDVYNLRRRKSGERMILSTQSGLPSDCRMFRTFGLPSLCNLVSYVIIVSAKPKMIRIAAKWIVAIMQAIKSDWNRTDGKSIRSFVCSYRFPVHPKCSIAFAVPDCLRVGPTGVFASRLVHLFPESFFCGFESLKVSRHVGYKTLFPNYCQ